MLPRNHPVQIILFSATFPDQVRMFASKFAPNSNKIELQKEELSVEGIRQFYMDCKNEEHKYDILVSLYSLLTIGQSIIFCQVSFDYQITTVDLNVVVAPAYGGQNFGADDRRRA
jgi:ATP-dependent RNA helicase DDX19/DBP5